MKIAPLGEMDGIPNNTPHPGCTFQVEWYGFDQGDDIISTVTFAMQAPTKDVALSVAGNTSVFVGGDPASGAGTDTGLDGTEAYTLSFDGTPHPKQGYHVKLTIATPKSKGNDTKTKVFWVEPCTDDTTGGTTPGGTTPGEDGTGSTTPGDDTDVEGTTAEDDIETSDDQQGTTDDTEVLGTQASTGDNNIEVAPAEAQVNADGSQVPTSVDAGENGAMDWVRSPMPLLIIALGGVLAAAAFVTRRRSRVAAGE